MNVQKFYEAIAKIIAAREGVRIEVKSIKKVPEAGGQPAPMPKGI